MRGLFCGFDTSNYTTSCAVCNEDGAVVANIRKPLNVGTGERGLRQSDAVFAHVKNLPDVIGELGKYTEGKVLLAAGVSSAPRGAEGSYMPCFLPGVAAASSFAAGAGIPLYRFSHQQGHVFAACVTSGAFRDFGNSKFLAFHVSGGTTELILAQYSSGSLSCEAIGGTADLNAGQVIDRIGVRMGFDFPAGRYLDELAVTLAPPKLNRRVPVNRLECNLSGLENLAVEMIGGGSSNAETAVFVLEYLAEVIKKLVLNARGLYGNLPLVFAGGVMSSVYLSSRLSQLGDCYFTRPEFSADNACGIALLCREAFLSEND